jgi:hypothetical protein
MGFIEKRINFFFSELGKLSRNLNHSRLIVIYTKALATSCTATVQNFATISAFHTLAESVFFTALTNRFFG